MRLTNNALLLPIDKVETRDLLRDTGRSDKEIAKIIATTGILSFRNASPKLLTEFVFDGLGKLQTQHEHFFTDVDAVIVVSQSFDERIPSISTRIQSKFNIKSDAFCIDLMDGCCGYIKALSLAQMLEAQGFKKSLVVAGDLNSMMTTKADIGTKLLFGDGISVTTLEADTAEIAVRLFNDGDNEKIITCDSQANVMRMNGFEVFRFTKNMVPPLITTFLEGTGQTLSSFDALALHQASKLVVSTICNQLNYQNKLADDFACVEIGNIGAGSIGAWLASATELPIAGPQKMLAVGFGAGLSWGLASGVVDVHTNEVINV